MRLGPGAVQPSLSQSAPFVVHEIHPTEDLEHVHRELTSTYNTRWDCTLSMARTSTWWAAGTPAMDRWSGLRVELLDVAHPVTRGIDSNLYR